jgi:hypothetical protein
MNYFTTRTLAAGLVLSLAAVACGSEVQTLAQDSATTVANTKIVDETVPGRVVSAVDGAAARARLAALRPGAARTESAITLGSVGIPDPAAESSSPAAVSSDGIPLCGIEPYVPTAEEIAAANADSEGLAAVFEEAGIAYSSTTDSLGFVYVEYDYEDSSAQDVAGRFWFERYPPEPIDPADLVQNKADNDVIAASLDSAGVVYERSTDLSGWESVDFDYEDPQAQAAMDAADAELYPPQPPTAEDLAWMNEENDRISAALTAAGIGHARVSDDLGFEWIEWDFEDATIADDVMAVFDELYGFDVAIEPAPDPNVSVVNDAAVSGPVTESMEPVEVVCEPSLLEDAAE